MDFDQNVQFPSDYDDDLFPEPVEEIPLDVQTILSKPFPRLEQQGDIFEEWLDEHPLPTEGELPPEEDYNQRYGRIFQETEEGELTSDELIQNLNAWVDDEPLSSGPLYRGIPVEPTLDTGAAGWSGGGGSTTPAVSGDAGALGQIVTGAETGGEGASEAVDKTDLLRLAGAGAAIAAGAGALLNEVLKKKQGSEPEAQWYYSAVSKQYGPMSESELRQKLQSGAFSGQGYVWREGMKDWISVSQSGLLPLQQAAQSAPVQQVTSPAADAKTWYYIDTNQRTIGPITRNDLIALITVGQLSAANQVWTDGMNAWQSAVTAGLVPASGVNSAGRQCPSCHQPLAAGDRFCGKCGTKI